MKDGIMIGKCPNFKYLLIWWTSESIEGNNIVSH